MLLTLNIIIINCFQEDSNNTSDKSITSSPLSIQLFDTIKSSECVSTTSEGLSITSTSTGFPEGWDETLPKSNLNHNTTYSEESWHAAFENMGWYLQFWLYCKVCAHTVKSPNDNDKTYENAAPKYTWQSVLQIWNLQEIEYN